MMRVSKRKGFTLVELLIVIVVIGILASAMMLASGGATDSAKASAAISELRSAKAAGLMWFADDPNRSVSSWSASSGSAASVLEPYMDNSRKVRGLSIAVSGDSEAWIGMGTGGDPNQPLPIEVLRKIQTQAGGVVYYWTTVAPNVSGIRSTPTVGDLIYMRVK